MTTTILKKMCGVFLGTAWLVALTFGASRLFIYDNLPGAPANSPVKWPTEATLSQEPGKFNLVLFLHPQCPCSEATLDNLQSMMPTLKDHVQVDVFFFKPATRPLSWVNSRLWSKATHIDGVWTHVDIDGAEASRFDSVTSGQAILYGVDGTRLFQGGITSRRGHSGDSTGADAIISFVNKEPVEKSSTPVFGCALSHPERAIAQERSI